MLKTTRTLFLTLMVLLLMGNRVNAQMPDYHVRVFSEKDGIRPSQLFDLVRDEDGFLWLMYGDRVLRFDGKRTKEFALDDRLVSIKHDKDNSIWVNSPSTLYKFMDDGQGFQTVRVDTTGQPQLISILELPDNTRLLLTDRGFYRYQPKQKQFVPIGLPFTISPGLRDLQTSFGNHQNTFFYNFSDTLVAVNAASNLRKEMYAKEFYSLTPINGHTLLVSDWKSRTFKYDFSENTVEELKIDKVESPAAGQAGLSADEADKKDGDFFRISDALPLDSNRFLLTTNKGLAEYNASSGKLRLVKLFYNGQPYTTLKIDGNLYMDDRKNVWVVTNTGLLVFNPYETGIGLMRNWEEDPSKAFSNHIRNFAADEKGNLWMATLNGFASLSLKNGTTTPYHATANATDRLNHPSIRGIVFDGQNLILGQTNRGIWLYNPLTKKYKRPPNTPLKDTADFVDQIYTLHNGNHVIVARFGLYLMDGKSYRIKRIGYPGEQENPAFCYQDIQNRVWIGTRKDLYCFDGQMNYRFAVGANWPSPVYSMCQADENAFYIGSKGLYKLTLDGQKAKVEKVHPFFDNIGLVSIYKDKSDKLWMGSEKGIFSYHPLTENIEEYGYFDNVQSGMFYINSLYRSPGGLLFMGGTNGFNYFYPEKLKGRTDTLNVSLQKVLVNGEDAGFYPHFSELDLKHSQNNIEITFSAPYFNNPNRVQYRYRMNGLDKTWTESGTNNRVRFSSLAAGDYTFWVAASINGRDWFENQTPLHLNISPPFWKTWWFITLVALFLLAGLYWWIHVLRQRIRSERIINRFASSLFGQNTVEETFWDLAKNCVELLQFEDCVIYQNDENRGTLVQKAAAGPKGNPKTYKIVGPIEIPLAKGIVGAVAASQKAEIVKDTRKDPRYIVDDQKRLSEITVPIFVDGKLYGIIDSEHSKKGFFNKWHLGMLTKIAGLCGEKASKQLIEENIREKIASDLHDEIGSTLTSINIVSKIAMGQSNGNETIQNHLAKIKNHSGQMMESMSDIVWAINPANDTIGQIALRMKTFAAELLEPLTINYVFGQEGDVEQVKLSLTTRKDVFLIYKEALNNAVKYSKATEITIKLKKDGNSLQIIISDNGIGFDVQGKHSGTGIKNMHKRAKQCGATLQLDSIGNTGTTILLQIPLTPLGYRNTTI